MRIAIVGAGGVGGYFGGRLAQAGADVVFIARCATLDALRSRGLRVDSINGDFEVAKVNATDDASSVGNVDAVLIAVKAWQVREAAESIRPLVGAGTIVVPLENGMEAPDDLTAALGRDHVLGGLCGIVSFVVAPGHIRHIGADPFIMFGELDNQLTARAQRLRDALVAANIKADIPPNIHHAMWTKFLFIASFSAIGASTRAPLGVWRTMLETRALAEEIVSEALAVANARGAALPHEAVAQTMSRFDGLAPESTPSMQRDVMEGKPSELDAQLGAVVRMGRAAGVPTPIFDVLYRLLLPQERRARGEAT
jgi:2-dehydropantoate 2-reductase